MTTPGLPNAVTRFVEAVHRGDTKAFLAFFPIDSVVVDTRRRFAGHDKIRGWGDRDFIEAHGRIIVKKVQQMKNHNHREVDWESNFYSGPARFEFVLDGEQIRELRTTRE